CTIGPFARLRSGVSIADEARVGNFVELVRSKIGPRVRINHMSYLGDATVEEAANIGAGTITANYNGKEKHATHIGKGAFIGSDTVLIAPVNVGAYAVTGAGSVVPKGHDVPAKGVVVGVPAHALNERPVNGRAAVPGERPSVAAGRGTPAAAKPSARVRPAPAKKKRPVQKAKKATPPKKTKKRSPVKTKSRPKPRAARRAKPRRIARKSRR
ncbi:MAG: hypothetical protein Q8R78_05005, partial [Candidatus Omnitrophota bacterium]|nr:hypothetical protein [Candidatus Omnitrophota bacterium]